MTMQPNDREEALRLAREALMPPIEITSNHPVIYPTPESIERFYQLCRDKFAGKASTIQACHPEDHVMLATAAGKELVEVAIQALSNTYWLIERGSPAEYWVQGQGEGDGTMLNEEWTHDHLKAMHLNEWGAKKHAKELEEWGVKGPLRACEHMDMQEPAPTEGKEG